MALGLALLGSATQAQTLTAHPGTAPLTLQALFEQAWQREPEAQSAALRRDAAQAAHQPQCHQQSDSEARRKRGNDHQRPGGSIRHDMSLEDAQTGISRGSGPGGPSMISSR